MLKKIIYATSLVLVLQSSTFAFPTPNRGDVFSGNSNSNNNQSEQFGASPSVCNDPQISRIEQESGTTARVFEYASSGTKEGQFGRWLETNGFVYHSGVCIGKPGSIVMFIYNNRVPEANKVANEFFSGNSSPQNPPSNNQISDDDAIRDANAWDEKSFRETCAIVFQQQGNFNGFPNCSNCQKYPYPECLNLIAQLPPDDKLPAFKLGATKTNQNNSGPSGLLVNKGTFKQTTQKPQRNKRRGTPHEGSMQCVPKNLEHLRQNKTGQKISCERPTYQATEKNPSLPTGAVGPGDPRAAQEVGAPGIIGSFPGTKNNDFCWTYCLSQTKKPGIPGMGPWYDNPDLIGRPLVGVGGDRPLNALKPGDVLVFFSPPGKKLLTKSWTAAHYAVYQGNGIVYFKNGTSDVYVGKLPDYLNNFVGWKARVF